VTVELDAYEIQRAIQPIVDFVDLLNNWYIRRSRRRFWRSENDADKNEAYETLYTVLMTLIRVAAPFIPFVTEEIHRNLRTQGDPISVHLCDFPSADSEARDHQLELKMSVARKTVSMGRALRGMHSIKTRQPLRAFHAVTKDQDERTVLRELEDIIREELNVKDVVFRENEEDLVEYRAKANYRVLGKRLGKHMKAAAKKIESLAPDEIQSLMDGATLALDLDGETLDLDLDGVVIQRMEKEGLKVLNEGSLTVALDPEVTDELYQEGIARDLVRSVQNLRKERGLEVTDRIRLYVHGSQTVRSAVEAHEDYIREETLAESWHWEDRPNASEAESGDESCRISLEPVSS
jgi:isoleucyl-tRNA synthetase